MGWNGIYADTTDAANDIIRDLMRSGYIDFETKIHKTYAHIACKHMRTREHAIYYFIFKDGYYKDIPFWDSMHLHRLPKKWLSWVYDDLSDFEKSQIEEYQNQLNQKKSQPKLDDILKPGKKYKVFGDDNYIAEYAYKHKRSHLFYLNGKLTRFVGLKDISQIEEVA